MDTRRWLPKYRLSGKHSCVYCGGLSTTDDHTPPECLLRPPLPSHLMTLPSCQKCNVGFSWDEDTVKVFLATVSSHPDLRPGSKQGQAVLRGLERDARRKALIEAQRVATGGFRISEEMLRCFDVVSRKTVRGLYYGNYRKLVPMEDFHLISGASGFSMGKDRALRSESKWPS